jgi:hypothetical protein
MVTAFTEDVLAAAETHCSLDVTPSSSIWEKEQSFAWRIEVSKSEIVSLVWNCLPFQLNNVSLTT